MNLIEVTKSDATGKQTSEFKGDGRSGVTVTAVAQWGTAYRANAGALGLQSSIDGNDGNSTAMIPQTPDGVPDLAEGESAFGNFAAGCFIHFKNDGTVSITATRVEHNGKNIGESHVHPQNDGNDAGGGINTSGAQ